MTNDIRASAWRVSPLITIALSLVAAGVQVVAGGAGFETVAFDAATAAPQSRLLVGSPKRADSTSPVPPPAS